MSSIGRYLFNLGKNLGFQAQRTITTTPVNHIKEIITKKEGKTLIIEARILEDPQQTKLIKPNPNGACILCSTGLDIKHTDVMIISQFVRSDGRMLPRRVTGLCRVQQKRVGIMVTMAHKAGLLSNLKPKNCWRDPTRRRDQKAFNTYYDENTIRAKYRGVTYVH